MRARRFYLPKKRREKAEDAAKEQKMWVLIKSGKQRSETFYQVIAKTRRYREEGVSNEEEKEGTVKVLLAKGVENKTVDKEKGINAVGA